MKGNRNGISWAELATDLMVFHSGWPFRRNLVSQTTAIWAGSDHAEFSVPNLAQMASELRLLVMATRKLFGSVPPGHPWHRSECSATRALATAGFTVNFPGLASRPALRHPARVHEALAGAAAHGEANPLDSVVLPNTAKPLPLWGRTASVESLTTPTEFPPPAVVPLGG